MKMVAFSIGVFVGGLLGIIMTSLYIVVNRAAEAERRYYENLDRK